MSENEKGVEMEKEVEKGFLKTVSWQLKNIFEDFSETLGNNKKGALVLMVILVLLNIENLIEGGENRDKNRAYENQLDQVTETLNSAGHSLNLIHKNQLEIKKEISDLSRKTSFYGHTDEVPCLRRNIEILKYLISENIDIKDVDMVLQNCKKEKGTKVGNHVFFKAGDL